MESRRWQTPIVLLILAVMAALLVIWMAPATAEEVVAKRKPVVKAKEVVTNRQPVVKAKRDTSETQPKSSVATAPVERNTAAPEAKPQSTPKRPVSSSSKPSRPVLPRTPKPEVAPVVAAAPVTLPSSVKPQVVHSSGPTVAIADPEPDPVIELPHVSPAPPPAPPTPPPALIHGPVVIPGEFGGDIGDLHCSDALVCPLDRWDDFIAWQLVRFIGVRYWEVAYERLDGWSWYAVVERLQIPRRDFYGALGIEGWSDAVVFSDSDVVRVVRRQVGFHRLVTFRCTLPIELPGPPIYRPAFDRFDRIVVARIADEMLWCEDVLWSLYAHEGSWAGVARTLYLSPYIFEACFGVDLRIDAADFVRYPSDDEIVWGIQHLESLAHGDQASGPKRRGLRVGGVALMAVAMGAVAGLLIGF